MKRGTPSCPSCPSRDAGIAAHCHCTWWENMAATTEGKELRLADHFPLVHKTCKEPAAKFFDCFSEKGDQPASGVSRWLSHSSSLATSRSVKHHKPIRKGYGCLLNWDCLTIANSMHLCFLSWSSQPFTVFAVSWSSAIDWWPLFCPKYERVI